MPLLLDITFLEQVVESDQIFSKAFKCKAIQDKNWAMNRFFFFFMKLLNLYIALKNKALI